MPFKIVNFPRFITSINGQLPDEHGNISIDTSSSGGGTVYALGYSFNEEYFTSSATRQVTLTHPVYVHVPLTISVNGVIYPKTWYTVSGSVITFINEDLDTGDYLRIVYAYANVDGFAYPYSEEYFTYSGVVNLKYLPILTVPFTISVNGIIISNTEYSTHLKYVIILEGVASVGDNIRVVYAYGSI